MHTLRLLSREPKVMANQFKLGEVVVLKSGGAPMTIEKCPEKNGRETYLCVWQKGATHVQQAYSEHTLEKFVPPVKK